MSNREPYIDRPTPAWVIILVALIVIASLLEAMGVFK